MTILVGPSRIPIQWIKAIFGSRSKIMYQLKLQKQREVDAGPNRKRKYKKSRAASRLIVNVRKYTNVVQKTFANLSNFFHFGTVEITPSNVTGPLCGSKEFALKDLNVACWDFINFCRRANDNSLKVIARHTQVYCHFSTDCGLMAKIELHNTLKCNHQYNCMRYFIN